MIKKIRVKKEFTLDELLEDVFNDTDEIYEVEVEEDITEDTEFYALIGIYDGYRIFTSYSSN